MHLETLLRELADCYGEPQRDGDNATYRWSIRASPAHVAVHLSVYWDQMRDRAVIWIFDPATSPYQLHVNHQGDVRRAMNDVKERLPYISTLRSS